LIDIDRLSPQPIVMFSRSRLHAAIGAKDPVMTELHIEIKPHPQGVIMDLSGNVGIDDGPLLERSMESVLEQSPMLVVIDMSRLTFISSVGMSMLVKLHRTLKQSGGHVRIVAPPTDVFGVLDRAHLVEIIPIYGSVPQAFGPQS